MWKKCASMNFWNKLLVLHFKGEVSECIVHENTSIYKFLWLISHLKKIKFPNLLSFKVFILSLLFSNFFASHPSLTSLSYQKTVWISQLPDMDENRVCTLNKSFCNFTDPLYSLISLYFFVVSFYIFLYINENRIIYMVWSIKAKWILLHYFFCCYALRFI